MALLLLPNELLLNIARNQESQGDISAFARTNHRCYTLLNSFLYAYNVRHYEGNALHWAANKGQLKAAQGSLQQGADIESKDQETQSRPLIQSARWGHADIVALLLAHGADPHAKNTPTGKDAITLAVRHNQAAVATVLLEHGIDANQTHWDGNGLLHIAAQAQHSNRKAVVKVLVEKGANLESVNVLNETPLQVACMAGSVEVARCLIECGADLHKRSKEGKSLLHLASSKNRVQIVKLLMEAGAGIETKDEAGLTALHEACWDGHLETATFLLDQGADIEAGSLKGHTPLILGVLWESTAYELSELTGMTELLLRRGANPNRGNGLGITPLHCSMSMKTVIMCNVLLQYGADPESRTMTGLTPLHKAAMHGSLEPARQLLRRAIDIQPTDAHGHTPLQLAARRNDLEFVKLLLEAGATPPGKITGGNSLSK